MVLFVALSFVALLLWQAWMKDYGPAPAPAQTAQQVEQAAAESTASDGDIPGAPNAVSAADVTPAESGLLETGQQIHVETDLYRVDIDTTGGDLRQVDLRDYKATNKPDSPPFRLMNDTLPNLFIMQSGLRSVAGEEATHHAGVRRGADTLSHGRFRGHPAGATGVAQSGRCRGNQTLHLPSRQSRDRSRLRGNKQQ